MLGKTNVIKSGEKDPLGNYTGDGSDGDIVIASGETYTVQVVANAESAILNCKSLTIENGGTLTVSDRCQGLIIKVKKDCIINGTINMDLMSPPLVCVNEEELAANPCITLFGGLTGGNGGKGGSSIHSSSSSSTVQKSGGAGGTGNVFGGGMAGGGAGYSYAGGSGDRPPVGTTWPYRGTANAGKYGAGGGSTGNGKGGDAPGGSGGCCNRSNSDSGDSISGINGSAGSGYGGGAIYLLVGGDLTLNGTLTAKGGNGVTGKSGSGSASYSDGTGSRWSMYSGSGGGGGGGLICIAYNGALINTAKLTVTGGTGGSSVSSNSSLKGTNGTVGKTAIYKFEDLLPSE